MTTNSIAGTSAADGLQALLQGKAAAVPVTAGGAFAALLEALGGGTAEAALTGSDAGSGTSAAQAGGLSQAGASGAELLAAKVKLAAGLRRFEAEVQAAVASALAAGNSGQAQAIVTGAAKVLGALLGATDSSAGTNAMAALEKSLSSSSDGKGGAESGSEKSAGADPQAEMEALFGWVSSALGLVRPVQSGEPTESQTLLAAASGVGTEGKAKTAGAADAAAPDLAETLRALAAQPRAGQSAAAPGSGSQADPEAVRKLVQEVLAGAQPAEAAPVKETTVNAAATSAPPPDFFGLVAAGAQAQAAVPGSAAHAQVAASAAPADVTGQAAARLSGLVTDQIRSASVDGGQMKIELKPRGLGEVEVEMKRDDSGKLQVVVRAENPMVLAALRNDQDRLSAILTGSGLAAAGSSLDFQDLGGRGQAPQQDRQRSAAVRSSTGDEGEATDWQPTIGRGRLDIRT